MRQIEQFLCDLQSAQIEILDYDRFLSGIEVTYGVNQNDKQHVVNIDQLEFCASAEMHGHLAGYCPDYVTLDKMIGLDDSVPFHIDFWDWYNDLDSDLKEEVFIDCIKSKARSAWMGMSVKMTSEQVKLRKETLAPADAKAPAVAA